MGAKRKSDVIDEQSAYFVRLREGGKQNLAQATHNRVVVGAAMAEFQSSNASLADVVGYLIERGAGKIE